MTTIASAYQGPFINKSNITASDEGLFARGVALTRVCPVSHMYSVKPRDTF